METQEKPVTQAAGAQDDPIMTVLNLNKMEGAEIDFACPRSEILASIAREGSYWSNAKHRKNGVIKLKKDTFAIPGDLLREEAPDVASEWLTPKDLGLDEE